MPPPRLTPQTTTSDSLLGLRIRTVPEAADGLEKKVSLESQGDLPKLLLGSMWRKHLHEGARHS